MLEIRRGVYMDEATLTLKPERFQSLKESVQRLVNSL